MEADQRQVRESFIRLIESQEIINNRYTGISRLGAAAGDGHFSLVLGARDTIQDQKVALKFFDPTKSGDSYRLRCFEREGEVLKRFQGQPNILQLVEGKSTLSLDVKTADGYLIPFPLQFIVVELASGNLNEVIYTGNHSPSDLLLLFREACKAVQRMHSQKMFHRDLKPSNFLLFGRKNLKLGDFGTAKSAKESILEIYNSPQGDLAYTSPELLCGLHIDPQFYYGNDFYSLGAILFEMFARSNLNLVIYTDISEILRRTRYFHATNPAYRKDIFHSLMPSMNIVLPDIFAFNDAIPHGIRHHLNELFQDLACIDYRKRCNDFKDVFRKLEMIRIILANEAKYERWKTIKNMRRKIRLSKALAKEER